MEIFGCLVLSSVEPINTRLGQVFDSCLKALLKFQVEDVVV